MSIGTAISVSGGVPMISPLSIAVARARFKGMRTERTRRERAERFMDGSHLADDGEGADEVDDDGDQYDCDDVDALVEDERGKQKDDGRDDVHCAENVEEVTQGRETLHYDLDDAGLAFGCYRDSEEPGVRSQS